MGWKLIGQNGKWGIYKKGDGEKSVFNVSKSGPPNTDGGYYDLWSLHRLRNMNPNTYVERKF